MLGSGPGGAPQAPPSPRPLDPQPPIPPPSPGDPPLQRPDVSGWTAPPRAHDVETAQKNLQDLEDAIKRHNLNPPNPYDPNAVAAYNSEANYYNSWAAQLHGQLDSWNAQYTPATPAKTADIPSWTQPAPQQPVHQGPGTASEPPVPQEVQDTLNQIDAGKWPGSANAPGTKGGGVFNNTPPPGQSSPLPTTDASGKPITYQKWDVNPKVPGQGRDVERIVTGSDGSAWYTTDHYHTFHRIR